MQIVFKDMLMIGFENVIFIGNHFLGHRFS